MRRNTPQIRTGLQSDLSDEAGFTLSELLGAMAVILIFLTLILPRGEHLGIRANETSAISSMRLINQMQGVYRDAYPSRGYATSLAALGGKIGPNAPTPEAAQLIPSDLASGTKGGYRFTVGGDHIAAAVPVDVGRSGNNGYCSEPSGPIRVDPKGGRHCTEPLD